MVSDESAEPAQTAMPSTAGFGKNPAAGEEYAVWAPEAQRVELVFTDHQPGAVHDAAQQWEVAQSVPLERADGGWWAPPSEVREGYGPGGHRAEANPGYGYRVDGQGPYPDPRSRDQPDTVHGPSRLDTSAADFGWTDEDWTGRPLQGAVIYELHPGTFTEAGTLDAAAERLEHLVQLGVTHVELLPVNSFSGDHNWGYDGVGWYAVDASYGGPEAYRRFVDACHRAGLAVVQDVVYNHLGPSGNYLPAFGPYLISGGTDWGDAVNLDGPGSDEVRRYILDNVRMWLEDYHVDGLRLDAVHALRDTRAVHLLEELGALAEELSARLGRPLPLVAEWDRNDPRVLAPRAPGGSGGSAGYGLAGQWSDDFHHAVHVALTGETAGYYADFEPLESLAKVLNRGYFHDGTYSSFRGRHHGRPLAADTPAHALVVSIQNHDQVGNRAEGDRLSQTLSEGRLAAGAALLLTGPFTPMLFMGEEWAGSTPWPFFSAHREQELGRAVTEGRRREFSRMGWDLDAVPDPQDPATVASAVLRWDEREHGRHARTLDLYRTLTRLRSEYPELTDPDRSTTWAAVDGPRRQVRMDRGVAVGSVGSPGAPASPGPTEPPDSATQTPGSVVLLAALGAEPMPIPAELTGHRLLVGHHDDGPLTCLPADGMVPAPGFVLLAR